jgi:hypothetical protein
MSKIRVIPGEYDCVTSASLAPQRLRRAHETPCDQATAYFLIAVMHKNSFPYSSNEPYVKFRKPRIGKSGARGWGGRRPIRDTSGRTIAWRAYVSLPADEMKSGSSPYGKLRVGLVCHEYAHAVEMLKFGKSDHGIRFTAILDELLYDTEQFWNTTSRSQVAAENR